MLRRRAKQYDQARAISTESSVNQCSKHRPHWMLRSTKSFANAWFCFCLAWILSTGFASVWTGFDAADWYAEMDTHCRWRRRYFYSILETCGHAFAERGDNVTVLAQLDKPLSWLGLAPAKAWRSCLGLASPEIWRPPYGGQFLYLHLFSFNILVNHDPNAISWVTP